MNKIIYATICVCMVFLSGVCGYTFAVLKSPIHAIGIILCAIPVAATFYDMK